MRWFESKKSTCSSLSAFIAVFIIFSTFFWIKSIVYADNGSMKQNLQVIRGAKVPWIEYEAEAGTPAGGAKVVGPSRALGTPAGEASGRMAVQLGQTGASIEWTAVAAANSIVIRVCIPDAPGGGGISASISLYINSQHMADIMCSSVHSWVYGGDNIQTDNPGPGARKIYDESHLLFNGFTINVGDKVMLRKDAADNAAYYAIDFIDLEQVAGPLPMPDGYISITDATQSWPPAKPDDGNVDDDAFNQCIAAVQQGKYKGVYIPRGTFQQTYKIMTTHVKIQGAGMWYSILYCPNKNEDAGWGETGFNINGDSCEFRDFAVFGWGGVRAQGGKAWVNYAHKNTVLERIWIESVQCGYWVGGPGESTNLLVKDCRIRNTGADGINLCNGSLNCTIENCHARNTGDDAFAIWSATDLYPHPCTGNLIHNCTVQIAWRAACFAIYGGKDNRIINCVGSDPLTYPGLTISSKFNPYPLESATIDSLTLNRCGGLYYVDQQFGAIWLFSPEQTFNNVTIRNVDIVDPTYQGIHIQSNEGGNPGYPIQNTLFENITISNPTTYGIQIKAGAIGGATFKNVQLVSNVNNVPRLVNQAKGFTVIDIPSSTINKNSVSPISSSINRKNGQVTVEFLLTSSAQVCVSAYQINGAKVVAFLERDFTSGKYSIAIGTNSEIIAKSGRGVLFVELSIDGNKQVFPMVFK